MRCWFARPALKGGRWCEYINVAQALLEIEAVRTAPYSPVGHPFVERLIGTIRRELLDRTMFWNSLDLQQELISFREYDNESRVHRSLSGQTPAEVSDNCRRKQADIPDYRWEPHCGGLYRLPVAA